MSDVTSLVNKDGECRYRSNQECPYLVSKHTRVGHRIYYPSYSRCSNCLLVQIIEQLQLRGWWIQSSGETANDR